MENCYSMCPDQLEGETDEEYEMRMDNIEFCLQYGDDMLNYYCSKKDDYDSSDKLFMCDYEEELKNMYLTSASKIQMNDYQSFEAYEVRRAALSLISEHQSENSDFKGDFKDESILLKGLKIWVENRMHITDEVIRTLPSYKPENHYMFRPITFMHIIDDDMNVPIYLPVLNLEVMVPLTLKMMRIRCDRITELALIEFMKLLQKKTPIYFSYIALVKDFVKELCIYADTVKTAVVEYMDGTYNADEFKRLHEKVDKDRLELIEYETAISIVKSFDDLKFFDKESEKVAKHQTMRQLYKIEGMTQLSYMEMLSKNVDSGSRFRVPSFENPDPRDFDFEQRGGVEFALENLRSSTDFMSVLPPVNRLAYSYYTVYGIDRRQILFPRSYSEIRLRHLLANADH